MLNKITELFEKVRTQTEKLCQPLEIEDYVVQSMLDVSPTKWHLAHTSWFFETFLLKAYLKDYKEFHPKYNYLFNSYYNTIGNRHARVNRGDLTRPTVSQTYAYRKHVTENMLTLLDTYKGKDLHKVNGVASLGVNHEQQHQELLLTDIKHVFSQNPLYPVYSSNSTLPPSEDIKALEWIPFNEGVVTLGTQGEGQFCFDNEGPKHQVFVQAYQLANRLVTNGEYLEFIKAGGYKDHYLWLSEGWDLVCQGEIDKPFYWIEKDREWVEFTLEGLKSLNLQEPVCHLTYFEADAYARWAGARLPTEAEWENGVRQSAVEAILSKPFDVHPRSHRALKKEAGLSREAILMLGEVWEWTSSHYSPYPGYTCSKDAVGEYNGKFMSNQFVLRGASCITPENHVRITYRNFFPSNTKWHFSGIRLAK